MQEEINAPAYETIRFGDYRLDNVFGKITPEERSEAVRFWLDLRVMPRPEAERRTNELVYLVRRKDGALAGMSTVGIQLANNGRKYYSYRMLLHPQDRVPYLMREVTNATRDYLKNLQQELKEVAGMLINTENRKLMRAGMRRYLSRWGYEYKGQRPDGQDVWLVPFGND